MPGFVSDAWQDSAVDCVTLAGSSPVVIPPGRAGRARWKSENAGISLAK